MRQAFEVRDKTLLDAAELILAEVKAIGADEGETWVSRSALTELYYELGKVSMVRTVFTDKVSLKLLQESPYQLHFVDEMRMEYGIMVRIIRHPDFKEGVRAFVEKRTPRWTGQ